MIEGVNERLSAQDVVFFPFSISVILFLSIFLCDTKLHSKPQTLKTFLLRLKSVEATESLATPKLVFVLPGKNAHTLSSHFLNFLSAKVQANQD